jgi:hypothetical protein
VGVDRPLDTGTVEPALGSLAEGALCTAHAPVQEHRRALLDLRDRLGDAGCSLLVLFVSPSGDLGAIAAAAAEIFPGTPAVGCTTAGEICSHGYVEREVVAVGFPATLFRARTALLTGLKDLDPASVAERVARLRAEMGEAAPGWDWDFAFLLIDGLSRREDQIVAAMRLALGTLPLFGGSAGDSLDFRRTFVLADGGFQDDAAVLTLVRSRCPIRVFRFDNFEPTDVKMVVTRADPERRVVHEINAEPAAREYARLVGYDPDELSPFTFASHPIVVRVGGPHHVRAIQKVEPNGDLTFFSAIDEGLVLTVAEAKPFAQHLEAALAGLDEGRPPEAIIACDCILRRLAIEEVQGLREVSRILADHHVVGFSTYGEQFSAVHVNQTMTGVAIYPPEDAPP